jgi:AraC-like DNA-binding protein
VSNAIVERQKNFFVHGELAMRPLVLREIADELGLHESTISRVTTAKYMATPHRHLRAEVLLWLGPGHRDRRQRVQHRGARAHQAVHGQRKPKPSR